MTIPFDPFTSPIIRPSWRKKIKLLAAPKALRATGMCCLFLGWSNGKPNASGIVRVKGRRRYLHRYVYAKYHGIELPLDEPLSSVCGRHRCFNPLHVVPKNGEL